mgnify:CR=1 FL=1
MSSFRLRKEGLCSRLDRLGRRRLLVTLMMSLWAVVLAPAQAAVRAVQTPIAAQPLETALVALAEQTELQILYVGTVIAHRRSSPVSAGLPALEALRQMLADTDIAFDLLRPGAVRLTPRERVPTSAAKPASLDEVVVVASHREQALLAVSVSARVVNLAEHDAFGMVRADEVLSRLPGVDYAVSSQWGAGLYNHFDIRGIAAERSGTTTVVYLGDTPLFDALTPHSMFTTPFPVLFDLDRLEILRGPQGVEFGAGAEGGALRFVPRSADTRNPSYMGAVELGAIERGGALRGAQGIAATPVLPGVLGVRIAAFVREEGGYVDRVNPFTGETVQQNANRTALSALRASVAYEPNESLSIRPSFSYQSMHQRDSPMFYVALSNPSNGVLRNGKLMAQPFEETLKIGALRIDQHWPSVTLTSITSVAERDDRAVIDQTNEAGAYYFGGYGDPSGPEVPTSYADAVTDRAHADLHHFSQELRLMSSPSARRFVWSAGLFYGNSVRSQSDQSYLTVLPDLAAIAQSDLDHSSQVNVFAQARWAMTSHWKVGAGLRGGTYHTSTRKLGGGYLDPSAGPATVVRNSGSLPITPRFDISYQFNERWMGYALASRGARIGKVTPTTRCNEQTFGGGYGADSLWNYEIGTKGSVWSDALTFDVSVYDVEWRNVQARTYDPCGNSYMTSAGNVVSRGVDFTLQARPNNRLLLALDLSTGDVRSRDTVYGAGGVLVAQRGAAMSGVPDVPAPWTGTLRAEYVYPIRDSLRGTVNLMWSVRSHHPGPFPELNPAFPTYDPRFASDPATSQWNAALAIELRNMTMRLHVDNLLNTQPVLQRSGDAPGTPILYAYTQHPRSVNLSAEFRH